MLEFVLSRADDALVLGHRLSEWCGRAPSLEEDVALANIGLDMLGQARSLYQLAAEVEGAGRDEDFYPFMRSDREYRNVLLVEQPNGDFAQTVVRGFLYAGFIEPWWAALAGGGEARLAAIAGKAVKESAYHWRHMAEWMIRLGDGTAESHRRVRDALDRLWPYAGELFEQDFSWGEAPDPSLLKGEWDRRIDVVLTKATLGRPARAWSQTGGRRGRHSEHLGRMLAEMQVLPRMYPGAQW